MEVNEFLLQKEILLYVYFDCIITKFLMLIPAHNSHQHKRSFANIRIAEMGTQQNNQQNF